MGNSNHWFRAFSSTAGTGTLTLHSTIQAPASIPLVAADYVNNLAVQTVDARPFTYFFPNPNLARAVAENFSPARLTTSIVTTAELATLTSLSASDREIECIEGIQHLTGLRWLDLSHNQISDVSPLAGMDDLFGMNLACNRITDASPLVRRQDFHSFGIAARTALTTDREDVHEMRMEFLQSLHTDHWIRQRLGGPLGRITAMNSNPWAQLILNLDNNQISDLSAFYIESHDFISAIDQHVTLAPVARTNPLNVPNVVMGVWGSTVWPNQFQPTGAQYIFASNVVRWSNLPANISQVTYGFWYEGLNPSFEVYLIFSGTVVQPLR